MLHQVCIVLILLSGPNQLELLHNPQCIDLKEDHTRWNATNTHYTFLQGKTAVNIDVLQKAFEEGDSQSKTSLVEIVKRRNIRPWDLVIKRVVEDLKNDRGEGHYYFRIGNAKSATIYLLNWWTLAEPYIRNALTSDDSQQQFRAAIIVGFAGSTKDMKAALPILMPHIYDNKIMGDARLAVPALYHFGPKVVPLLLQELENADEQAHAILLHIIERLEYPNRLYHECRHQLPWITNVANDPVMCSLSRSLDGFMGTRRN